MSRTDDSGRETSRAGGPDRRAWNALVRQSQARDVLDGAIGVLGATFASTIADALPTGVGPNAPAARSVTFDDGGTDVWDVVRTEAGGYALCGATTPPADRRPNVWLGAVDDRGRIEWTSRPFESDGIDAARSMTTASDGGYVVAGTSSSHGDDGLGDALLAKTDDRGRERWQKRFGDVGFDRCNCVVRTRDGGYVLGGGTHVATGGLDAWLMKTDADGEREWDETYDTGRVDLANAVVQTGDGGYLLAGRTGVTETDGWVVKTDDGGTVEWERRFGGAGSDVVEAAVETTDGGFVLVGHTTPVGATRKHAWVVTLDGLGTEEWSRTYATDDHVIGRDVVRTSTDEYAIVCETLTSAGRSRAVLSTIDDDGNWLWERTFATGTSARAGLVDPSSGGYVVAGTALARRSRRGRDAWMTVVPPAAGQRGTDDPR